MGFVLVSVQDDVVEVEEEDVHIVRLVGTFFPGWCVECIWCKGSFLLLFYGMDFSILAAALDRIGLDDTRLFLTVELIHILSQTSLLYSIS